MTEKSTTRHAPFSTRTSGDLTADRRYAYGDAAFSEADFVAARDLFEQTIECAPLWPPAHFALGKAALALGEKEAARAAFRQVLALDPEDRLGATIYLGQLGAVPVMPDAYVAALFDEYAPRFDGHLVEALNYRAPAMLATMLADAQCLPARNVLDLGCGTGLMAKAIAGQFTAMTGVDLSAGMLEIARKTGLYSRLEATELLSFLKKEPANHYDLVLAADVFCYVPDLGPVFEEAHRVLNAGGHFAFTIQTKTGEGYEIGLDARVHHAPGMVHHWAAAAGLVVEAEIAASTREDRGEKVPGALFLLAKA